MEKRRSGRFAPMWVAVSQTLVCGPPTRRRPAKALTVGFYTAAARTPITTTARYDRRPEKAKVRAVERLQVPYEESA
jgi:hypothetical protein